MTVLRPMHRGVVCKLSDFGLAKLMHEAGPGGELAISADHRSGTITHMGTLSEATPRAELI